MGEPPKQQGGNLKQWKVVEITIFDSPVSLDKTIADIQLLGFELEAVNHRFMFFAKPGSDPKVKRSRRDKL